jgi:hypothetical protein
MNKRSDPHHQHYDPGVDVVPGQTPVPVNIWRLPAGDDLPVGDRLAARLLAEYTRPGERVYDTVPSPALRKAAQAAGRGYRASSRFRAPAEPAALAVAVWPVPEPRPDPVAVFGGLRRRLQPGGYLVVAVTPDLGGPAGQPPVELGPLVGAAIAAGLAYLQHIVTMPTTVAEPAAAIPAAPPTASGGGVHDRVHTDILVFRRNGAADA